MQVIEDRREEPEERSLIELRAELLVGSDEDKDDDREDLVEVPDLGLVDLGTVGVAVVLQEEDENLGEGVHGDEGGDRVGDLELGVSLDGDLGADTEEEEGDLVSFEDALTLEVGDDADEGLLGRGCLLEESDPLEEVVGQAVSQSNLGLDSLLLARSLNATSDLLEQSDNTR